MSDIFTRGPGHRHFSRQGPVSRSKRLTRTAQCEHTAIRERPGDRRTAPLCAMFDGVLMSSVRHPYQISVSNSHGE